MAGLEEPLAGLVTSEASQELVSGWRRLTRAATGVALLTSPALFVYFMRQDGWPWWKALLEEDALARRRAWVWHWRLNLFLGFAFVVSAVFLYLVLKGRADFTLADWWHTIGRVLHWFGHLFSSGAFWQLLITFFIFGLFNFGILFGPLLAMNLSQMRAFEPGDAEWGVRLNDVRGQEEAKEEVRRVVTIWQSGEQFERSGGKRERGLLFLGAPGTGKTMLAKAIATGFNSPFVSMPGSGFAATFIGIDAIIVRLLARKAKRLARKWGGQCIVFIDEIDAVGMRRQALQQFAAAPDPYSWQDVSDFAFYGPWGARNPSGDLIVETRRWRERLFEQRAPSRWTNPIVTKIVNQFPGGLLGGMGGGQLALNQLLVAMDGIDNPPFLRRTIGNRVNTFLDSSYIVPQRIGPISLRLPRARPRGEQIYFIGATNVPIERLDPALTRPGRMGRHVWFRTPTKDDRKDVFDLYLGKVAHDPDLDTPHRRDEIARITNGYAQPLDAQLLTPTGWTTMGTVAPGDLLVGADGTPTEVLAVHPRGEMDVYRVSFNDGTSTECTADHLWTVEAADPRMTPRTLTLRELVERGLRWSQSGSRFYVPQLAPAEFTAQDLPLDPYLLGLLLGDGGFTSTTADFCTADLDSLAAVEALLPTGVSAIRHGPMNWWLSSGPRGGVQRGRRNPLTERLRELELWGVRGDKKFVPRRYKWTSQPDRLAVLQGLMDADGTCDYRRGTGAEFSSHSRRLAEDVAFLARSLGGTARIAAKREGWRVSLQLADDLVPFRLARKADMYRVSRRPFRKRIVSVEPVGRKPVQCVTVVAVDGLYVTDGLTVTHNSPAMIDQVCSMALTNAQHEGRIAFTWDDLVQAMTTIESGTAIDVTYPEHELRAVSIHEAGHAVTAHVYRPELESSRLSTRMRGGSLGHHQTFEREERFSRWQHEQMGALIHVLGAMAAENVFYGENTGGVGGDLQTATDTAAWMVGTAGMRPLRVELDGKLPPGEDEEAARERIMRRFEQIGRTLMNRTQGSADFHADPIASILRDPYKSATAAQLIGQAYVTAVALISANRVAVERVAQRLVERRELFGDELLDLLDEQELVKPELDYTKEELWPKL